MYGCWELCFHWKYQYEFIIFKNFFFLLCPLKGPRSNDMPVAMSTHSTEILVLNAIFHKRNQSFWRKFIPSPNLRTT